MVFGIALTFGSSIAGTYRKDVYKFKDSSLYFVLFLYFFFLFNLSDLMVSNLRRIRNRLNRGVRKLMKKCYEVTGSRILWSCCQFCINSSYYIFSCLECTQFVEGVCKETWKKAMQVSHWEQREFNSLIVLSVHLMAAVHRDLNLMFFQGSSWPLLFSLSMGHCKHKPWTANKNLNLGCKHAQEQGDETEER